MTVPPAVMDRAEIERLIVGNHDWYHTLELAPGVITPGWVDTRSALSRVPMPESLAGKRCLDVGTWDGFWAFEMERRGAAEVIGLDVPDPYQWDWPARARIRESFEGGKENLEEIRRSGNGFPIAREILRSSVVRQQMPVYDISREQLGGFDFVFVGSLLLHLRDPVGALERIRSVVDGEILFNESIQYVLTLLQRRTPTARLDAGDRVWWWQPNLAALLSMIEQSGFEVLERGRPYFMSFGPRYPRPKQRPGEIARRLTSAIGWEQLLLYRRGIAHVAIRCQKIS
jgi:tRNA (mo5U34)-methyltransferase